MDTSVALVAALGLPSAGDPPWKDGSKRLKFGRKANTVGKKRVVRKEGAVKRGILHMNCVNEVEKSLEFVSVQWN